MKYLMILLVVTSCALPTARFNKDNHRAPKLKRADRIERCIGNLIGVHEVSSLNSAKICIDIHKPSNETKFSKTSNMSFCLYIMMISLSGHPCWTIPTFYFTQKLQPAVRNDAQALYSAALTLVYNTCPTISPSRRTGATARGTPFHLFCLMLAALCVGDQPVFA